MRFARKSPAEEGRICFVFAKKFARLAFSGCPSIVPIASLCCFRLPLRLSRLSLRLLRVSYSVFPDWSRPEEVASRRMKNAPLCMCRAAHNCYQLSAEYSCPRRVVSVAYNAQRYVIVSGLQPRRMPPAEPGCILCGAAPSESGRSLREPRRPRRCCLR